MKLHIQWPHNLAWRYIFEALINTGARSIAMIGTNHLIALSGCGNNRNLMRVISVSDLRLLNRLASPLNDPDVSILVNLTGLALEPVKKVTPPV
jgi:hypothetical protein